jgi:hypothetical protein
VKERKIVETGLVAVGIALLAAVVMRQPPMDVPWAGAVAAWFGLSFLAGAGWSMIRGRQAELEEEALRLYERTARATTGRPRDFAKVLKPPKVTLTAHQLTRLNTHRRLSGRPQLSPHGFSRAIEKAPKPTNDGNANHWLFYLLMYDASNHPLQCQTRDDIEKGLTIYNAPSEGHFGGAGASGSWSHDEGGATFAVATTLAVAANEVQRAVDYPGDSHRQTFEVPQGYYAVRDAEGRATGAIAPLVSSPSFDSDIRQLEAVATNDAAYTADNTSTDSTTSSDSGGGGGGD